MKRSRYLLELSISDWAGIGNLVLAAIAIAISLYVFHKQSQSDKATSAVLVQSRDALRTATQQLGAEQAELTKVTGRLATADAALGKLEARASDQTRELDAADAALRRVLNATTAQYSVDEKIFGVTQQQYGIVANEHQAALAQLRARPKMTIRIEYDVGAKRYVASTKQLALGIPVFFPLGNERTFLFRVIFTNVGNALAQRPKAIIYDWSGQLSIGGPCWIPSVPQTYQCNISDDIPPREEFTVPFVIEAPKAGGAYKLSVSISSITANGAIAGFTQIVSIILKTAKP